jgi:glycosyltransferase involved in cell wall biosynthesis
LDLLTFSVIVCAYNEERFLHDCLFSLLHQTRRPDEIIVVNNASTDGTRAVAERIAVRVIDEPRKGLVRARETGRQESSGDVLAYVDADCRAPRDWLERLAREFDTLDPPAAVTGPYRFYDWDIVSRALVRMYDYSVAPATHFLAQDVFGMGAILYGGNFAVRRDALKAIGGFDTSIEFHGEDTNLARRVSKVGRVELCGRCYVFTSARRYKVLGRGRVFGLYARNFCAELFLHRPADTTHKDIRA